MIPSNEQIQTELLNSLHSQQFTPLQIIAVILGYSIPTSESYKLHIIASIIQGFYFIKTYYISILFTIFFIILFFYVLYLLFRFYLFKKSLKEEKVVLQIIPPHSVTQSPLATQEFFTALHDIGMYTKKYYKIFHTKRVFSLELVATREEGIRYFIVAPKEDSSLIKKTLLSYLPDAKIQVTDDYIPVENNEIALSNVWTTLGDIVLRNDFIFPLSEKKILTQHDPIGFLTGHMTKLAKNEMIFLQIVVSSVNSYTHKKLVKKLLNVLNAVQNSYDVSSYVKQRLTRILPWLPFRFLKFLFLFIIGLLFWEINLILFLITFGGVKMLVIEVFRHKDEKVSLSPTWKKLYQDIEAKLEQGLFETTMRLFVATNKKQDLALRQRGIMSGFATFDYPNYQLFEFKTRAWWFPRKLSSRYDIFKLQNRQFSLTQNPILSTSEIADLYHFPYTNTTKTENMVKNLSRELPAPLSLKQETELDVIFGINTYGGEDTEIGLTDDERSRHVYMIGQTGSGKTTIMFHMAKDDIQKRRGLAVVDPHGDLAEDILATIPKKRAKDFIYFNPFDIKHPVGINLLELTPGLDEDELELEKELVAEGVISIFRRVFSNDETSNAHRIEYILRNAIYTAFTIEKRTIFTVYELLNNPEFRKKVVKDLDDENLKSFWKNEFDKAGNYQVVKMISGVTAKVGRFLFSPTAKRILEQEQSTINFNDILDEGKILLCNVSEGKLGEDTSQLLGTTIITKIHQAALHRARNNPKERKPFYLFVDEFQNFATTSFTKLLSGGRKFGLRVTIAEQSTAQQKDRNIVNVILANTGTVICFRTASPVDEKLLLTQFAPYVEKGELSQLPRYRFYIKLGALEPEEPFSGHTLPIEGKKDQELIKTLIEESRKRYAIAYVKKEKPKVVVVQSPKTKKIKKTKKTIQTRSGAPV